MNNREEQILKLIRQFETNAMSIETVLSQINEISTTEVTSDELQNYWRSEDVEDFVKKISIELIDDPRSISEEYALELIKEILSDVTNDVVFYRNSTALEIRFGKSSGTFTGFIFYNDINDPIEILNKLKIDTAIQL